MPSQLRTGDIVAGFRITSLVGRGAVGSVYLAFEVDYGGRVALKLLGDELAQDERFRQRFLRESELAATLDHPNIVPTLASGEDGGRLYLAMEYVEGSDLRELLRRDGRLEATRAIDLVGQVAEALDAAHEAGLVHRDVKPGNVLVTAKAGGEHAYICDFGLARHVSSVSSLTGDRGFVGTIDYVSPEQVAGGPIDRRADVYSLGCLLFECLAGVRPYERDSELSVVFAHLNEPPPRLSDFRPELPPALDEVFSTALAKSPEARFQHCGDLIAAAQAALRGEALPRRGRPRRWRVASAVVAVALAAAAVGGVVLLRDSEPSPPAAISQGAIAGAPLGLTEDAYKKRFGPGWRSDVVTEPGFPVLIYAQRKQAIYFDPDTRRAIIVTSWNPKHRTAAGVGPCSSIEELEEAYGPTVEPSHWNTQNGKVYAYTVGKNLLFAAGGLPPDPGKHVTAVALYEGDGPKDDGRGVDVEGGTLPFAGYIAISESPCS
jgi:predicted Ser/Thr protein kinase